MSEATPTTTTTTAGGSRIVDRRYQRYTGPRKGEAHATSRLTIHAFQRLLGLRRPFKYKIVPILLGLGCFALPIGLIAIAVFVPGGGVFTFDYAQIYTFISLPIFLFVVITAPNGLITDRSTKSLSLYLASPLTRNTYLLAQGAAIAFVLMVVTVGPQLLYFLATVIQGNGPDGITGFSSDLAQILLAGIFLAVYFAAVTMVAGAFAERPSIAAGAIFITFTAVSGVVEALSRRFDSALIQLLSIGDLPDHVVYRIFDAVPPTDLPLDLSTLTIVGASLAWAVLFFAAAWWRYNRLVISR